MDKEFLKGAIRFILFCFMIVLIIIAIITGLNKQDYNTCQKLKGQSEQYRLFYLTINEKMMCDRLGVNINAPIEYNKEFYKLIK